ncbi:MAG TPA: hypothetical protein PLN19_01460 [Methanothrix sp.]|uniref:hypothetical protein n=1 Tax=Methanothrix sp. TaxID=90426 RepID=UPI002C945CCA|nr:hypothetical protein [Methanothrix sp.]HQE86918.1 hypothetical protein [Methanothrix sp.]HRU76423.1 hypothetical protein [Methanothrix sp.]
MSLAICPRCQKEVDLKDLRRGMCSTCWAEIKARNAGKPKPRGKAKVTETGQARQADGQVLSLLAAGIKVSETEMIPQDNGSAETIPERGNKVSETEDKPTANVHTKTISEKGNKVSGTVDAPADSDNPNTASADGHKVSETGIKVSETQEEWQNRMAEDLAIALRRIKALEEKVQKMAPLLEKEESRRDSEGMKKLRDELFGLLRKSPNGGVYISNLHGPHGQKGGRLGISKAQAFRLRDACRMDDRFRVMKAENSSARWVITLNQKIR